MKTVLLALAFFIASSSNTLGLGSFQVLNHQVRQGDVLIIQIDARWMPPATSSPSISIFGKQYLPNRQGQVFIGIPINASTGKYIATLFDNGLRNGWDYEEVEIISNNFSTRRRTPFTPPRGWLRERVIINQAFSKSYYLERYFEKEFVKPLDEIVIDQNRTIGGISSSYGNGHAGVDLFTLNPNTGKHQRPVMATNSGKIALIARNFSTEGNMVIIDHGSGIFSVYMHLSRLLVNKVGDSVNVGDIIAMTGRTGSAARGGPHLHFAVKIRDINKTQDIYVDPLKFIETMNQYIK